MKLLLKELHHDELESFWNIAFSDVNAKWTKFNGPYFKDKLPRKEYYINGETAQKHLNNPFFKAIYFNDQIIGSVSAYYEDGKLKRWLDVGICIYDEKFWHQGIGKIALSQWIDELFKLTDLPHIGLTTWSGNVSMMKLAEKVGLHQEARIPQVRYWDGKYWDSVKYGILSKDWFKKHV